jgi:hypothetical protein
VGLRDRLRKLEKAATEGAVVLRQRTGGVRAFSEMDVEMEIFLARTALLRGNALESEVLNAVRNATPESRAAFLERFGFGEELTMEARIIAPDAEGGWVEVDRLLVDGTVETVRHEGGTEEALRMKCEALASGPGAMTRG